VSTTPGPVREKERYDGLLRPDGGVIRLGTWGGGASIVVWALGAVLGLLYFALRPLHRPLYLGWMHLVFPFGWLLSYLVLAIVYYLVITPVGLLMRSPGPGSAAAALRAGYG